MSLNGASQNLTGKHVIYIDVDDEITGIIDKVRSADARIVALVLPKRATVLQSIVNMKLLKRSADEAKKHLVLITAEAGLLPLAGSVGLYVAKTLQSKPEIPELGAAPDSADLHDEEAVSMADDDNKSPAPAKTKLDRNKAVGELASNAAVGSLANVDDSIELDDVDDDLDASVPAAAAAGGGKKAKGKKFKIPNFNKFRLLLVAGGVGVVALIVLLYVCMSVLPKAQITIKTDSQSIATNVNLILSTAATKADTTTNTVPATAQSTQKTLTQQANATGQQNEGAAAAGAVTVSAGSCGPDQPSSIPNGTALSATVGGANLTYITQSGISFVASLSHGKCTWQGEDSNGNTSIAIAAQSVGAKYNTSGGTTFTLSSYSPSLSISGSASGGTDNVVQIVQQSDIDGATQKLGTQDTTSVKQELQNDLTGKGLTPITSTFNAGAPAITSSVAAGAQASSVTVTETITYTMLGVKQSDLQTIVAANVDQQINTSKQTILDYGLSSASYALQNQQANGALVGMQVTSIAGSQLNVATIKSQVAGKKAADAETIIKENPGVTDVTVNYSPFWVSSIPNKTSKISVQIEKPAANSQTK